MKMVKGITRRVVVIKSPDPRIFDEAIFLVKEDASHNGVTALEILNEAQIAAQSYIDSHTPVRKPLWQRLPAPVFALMGAGATALIWLAAALLG